MILIPGIVWLIYNAHRSEVGRFYYYLAYEFNSVFFLELARNVAYKGWTSTLIIMIPVTFLTAYAMARTGRTVDLPRY